MSTIIQVQAIVDHHHQNLEVKQTKVRFQEPSAQQLSEGTGDEKSDSNKSAGDEKDKEKSDEKSYEKTDEKSGAEGSPKPENKESGGNEAADNQENVDQEEDEEEQKDPEPRAPWVYILRVQQGNEVLTCAMLQRGGQRAAHAHSHQAERSDRQQESRRPACHSKSARTTERYEHWTRIKLYHLFHYFSHRLLRGNIFVAFFVVTLCCFVRRKYEKCHYYFT